MTRVWVVLEERTIMRCGYDVELPDGIERDDAPAYIDNNDLNPANQWVVERGWSVVQITQLPEEEG